MDTYLKLHTMQNNCRDGAVGDSVRPARFGVRIPAATYRSR